MEFDFKTIVGPVLIVFLVIIIFFILIKNPSSVSENKIQSPKLLLDVKYFIFYEGYTAPIVIIKNLNDFSWNDCEMKINDNYIAKIKEIPGMSSDNNEQIIPIITFKKSNGTQLDYSTNNIKSSCISCNKPQYRIFCGEFR